MGSKPSNLIPMDRPESGGADRNEEREASGLLDREKQKFAEAQTRKKTGDEQSGVMKRPGDGRVKRSTNKKRRPDR